MFLIINLNSTLYKSIILPAFFWHFWIYEVSQNHNYYIIRLLGFWIILDCTGVDYGEDWIMYCIADQIILWIGF